MCGICGEISFSASRPADPERVRAMSRRLAHRGPDGEGLCCESGAALGHRRRPTVLSDGAYGTPGQPGALFLEVCAVAAYI